MAGINIRALVQEVRADIAELDDMTAHLGQPDCGRVDVRREHLEALLEIAARHDECRPWVQDAADQANPLADREAVSRG